MVDMGINVEHMSNTLKSLGHPIRLEILLLLQENRGIQFGELSSQLKIESSGKLSFHLNKLEDLISKDDQGSYILNEKGVKAVEALRVMGLHARDDHQPNIEQIPENENKTTSSINFFDEITPAKFVLLAVVLGIVVLPIFYLGCIVLGAIYYRLVEQRGTIELKKQFNQYLLMTGLIPLPIIIISSRTPFNIMHLIVFGGLGSVLIVLYTCLYFIGAGLYVFFRDEHPTLSVLPNDIVYTFKEILIFGVIGLLIFSVQAVFDPPGLFEITRHSSDGFPFQYSVNITSIARMLMVSLIFGFYFTILSVQSESMAELILTKNGKIVVSILSGLIVLIWAIWNGMQTELPVVSDQPILWYSYWIIISFVTIIGSYFGQITGSKFISGHN